MPSAWQIAASESMDPRSKDAINNLQLVHDLPKPTPGPREALVNIKAAALNYKEVLLIAHNPMYPAIAIPNLTPCSDGAGIVEAVGPDSKWRVGDKVILTPTTWTEGEVPRFEDGGGLGSRHYEGTLREYAVAADNRLIRAPAHLSYTEAAALPVAAGTAANALFFSPSPIGKGSTVLAQGTGGVSALVIQLASAVGATVVATSSSDEKLEVARQLGATHLINYKKTPEWGEEVLRVTNGRGVDHVLDVAGAGTVEQSLLAARQGGLVSLIGIMSGSKLTDLIMPILMGAKTIRGILGVRTDHLEKAVDIYNEYQLHPPISKVYKWHDAKNAFAELLDMSGVGKIVIEVGA